MLTILFSINLAQARIEAVKPQPDLTRFQQIIEFQVEGITTPKVVTYKTPQTLGSFVALQNAVTHDYVPYKLTTTSNTPHWIFPVEGTSDLSDGNVRFLQDQNFENYVTFSNQDATPKRLSFNNPGLLSPAALNITLAPNTVAPKSVTVRALLSGEAEYSTILNKVSYQPTLTFPQIQPLQLEVIFETENLLRLTELEWTTNNKASVKNQQLSFYANEGDLLQLYIQPNFGQKRVSTTLNTPSTPDANTPVFNFPPATPNPIYNLDFDNDGLYDTQDLCPQVFDPTNADADKNGQGDACEDPDQDGINSSRDNCPFVPNPNQSDSDKDGLGDLCDDHEDRLSEQSDWWINLSFGIMVLALIFLIGRSAYSALKPKNK